VGYQPWYQGDTYPALQIPLNVEGNADNITGLTASSFTMILRNTGGANPVDTVGAGTFTIVTSSPAVVDYTFSPNDVATVWSGYLVVKAVFPGGGVAIYDPIAFSITAI
jgi:hypothetical protein